jgi:iron complex outermembrane receptor protein
MHWGFRGSVSILAVLAAFAAVAQDSTVLEEIVVTQKGDQADKSGSIFVAKSARTATKTGTPLIKTPQAVSVVTKTQFEQQGATTAAQALRYTPGVMPDIRSNDRYDIVPVRGMGMANYQNFIGYLDGLRMQRGLSFAQPTVDLFDVERIDVVRGPSSVLYGQIAPGGFVNLVSKRPTEDPYHEVGLTVGTDRYAKATVDLGGPLAGSDVFFYRLAASGRYNETNLDDVTSKRVSVSPSLLIKPEEGTSLTLLFNYTDDPASAYPAGLPAAGTAYANGSYANIPYDFNVGDPDFDSFERRTSRLGYEFEHEFNDYLTFRQNLRYTHIESEHIGLSGRSISGTTITRLASHLQEDVDTFVVDNQLQADFDTGPLAHTLLFGFDYQYADADRLMGTGSASSIDYLNPVYGAAIAVPAFTSDTRQLTSQAGFYAQDQIEFGKLNVTFGGRYDSYDIETDTTTLATGATTSTQQDSDAFTGRVGAAYLFDSGIAPYVSYATSFEPPTGLGYSTTGGVVLDPVEGQQIEAGVKYQPEGSDSYLAASVYHLVQSNMTTSDAAHSGYYLQVAEVTTTGVELEAKLAFDAGWNVTAAYTHVDAEMTENATSTYVGNRPYAVPENAASLWVHYDVQGGALEGLGLGAGVRYIGSTYGNEANTFKVSDFTLFDAALNYDFGRRNPDLAGLSLNVTASNIFNKEYVSSCSSTIACFYGSNRTVYATLKYKW